MKRSIIRNSQGATLRLVSDTHQENKSALSPFGPVRAGLTNTQKTQDQQLTELLNCLESEVATLESKYLEVCATLRADLAEMRAKLLLGILDTVTTDDVE